MLKTIKAGAAYFGIVFGAGFLLGCIRVPLIVPRLGVRTAELLEMPIQLAVVFFAARWVVRRFAVPPQPLTRLGVGLIALGLAVAAELVLVQLISAQSFGAYISGRDPVSGVAYLLVLVIFALMPMLTDRARTVRQQIPAGQRITE
ncbi:MAG: hypothetical protein M3R60_15380 [Pseudomonadota bacterium]|nr:hypothetical protein [Pseudomonadota bacterium]